jgi:hypothetical protein
MEAECSSEVLVINFYHTIHHHIPEDCNITHSHCYEYFRSIGVLFVEFQTSSKRIPCSIVMSFVMGILIADNELHGAEHCLRGHQLCSHSLVSQHFMEPKCSLLHS